MKVFFLVIACALTVCYGNVAEFERKLRANKNAQEQRWVKQKPHKKVEPVYRTMFELVEIAAFADLSQEAEAAVQQGTGFSLDVPGRPGAPARPPLEKLTKIFDIVNNEEEARAVINRTRGGGRPRRPGGDFDASPGVGIQAVKEPSVVVEQASKRLRKDLKDLRIRKAYRCLTHDERTKYHSAVNKLKQTRVGATNAYDVFAILHNNAIAPAAHFGPAFLPWHRYFLWMYEEALRQVEPDVVLPYWDSTADEDLNDPMSSAIWRDTHLGTSNGDLTSGPFAGWITPQNNPLRRNVTGDTELLYNEEIINAVLEPDTFDEVWDFFETAHGGPHVYVGGHMENLDTAAMDPLFFMHHAFVDCLWEEWREEKQYPGRREKDYPRDDSPGMRINHRRGSRALPFRVTNGYGLGRVFTKLYYKCQPRNTCPNDKCGCDRYSRDCEEGLGTAVDSFFSSSSMPDWLRDIFEKNAHGEQASC